MNRLRPPVRLSRLTWLLLWLLGSLAWPDTAAGRPGPETSARDCVFRAHDGRRRTPLVQAQEHLHQYPLKAGSYRLAAHCSDGPAPALLGEAWFFDAHGLTRRAAVPSPSVAADSVPEWVRRRLLRAVVQPNAP